MSVNKLAISIEIFYPSMSFEFFLGGMEASGSKPPRQFDLKIYCTGLQNGKNGRVRIE